MAQPRSLNGRSSKGLPGVLYADCASCVWAKTLWERKISINVMGVPMPEGNRTKVCDMR